ncbi:hypothetical protein KGF86_02025 [Ornithinibacillus massiliensis]|uniref:Uncharacterized protein n=1 Tax=Ornithinibacillus massiliensis TaxID=1944633 RepID=A0ABS5M9J9_9BACI|nr:hypothetical protein [Ornithinibacillus massiliensis]MBS3678979.1 hypothetical protein [Ornithinibacillus massiliensis]
MKTIQISTDILNIWDEKLLPNFDLLFFSKDSESLIPPLGPDILVFTPKDFFQDSSINTIDVINSYQLWGIKKELISYVCVVHPTVLPRLEKETLTEILTIQRHLSSGLAIERSTVSQLVEASQHTEINQLMDRYTFEEDSKQWFSMHRSLWNHFDQETKYAFLSYFAQQFIDDVSIDDNKLARLRELYPHLAPYFNSFATVNGANCLAATLAGISEQGAETDWIISQWVFESTLLFALKTKKYSKQPFIERELQPQDVLLWRDHHNHVIHACYHLEDGYFFNKHGQTLFNPWQINTMDNLYKTWGREGMELYRKQI